MQSFQYAKNLVSTFFYSLFCVFPFVISLNCQAEAGEELKLIQKYNALVAQDFVATSSDIHGKLVVGGDATLESYGTASRISTPPDEFTLLVGGELSYNNGRLFTGSILLEGDASKIADSVVYGLESGAAIVENTALPFNISDTFKKFELFAEALSGLDSTGSVKYQWGGAYLTGDCKSKTQVFNLDGSKILNVHTFALSCVPDDATVIFNLGGLTGGFKNVGLAHLNNYSTKILYNFYEAEKIELTWVGVEGTILAPKAHFENPRGSINGTVVAKSWNGPMEIHSYPFDGAIDIKVPSENSAPEFTSEPILKALEGEVYEYLVSVYDQDGDEVSLSFSANPVGMALDENSVSWTPTEGQVGENLVQINATDGKLTTTQEFSIVVEAKDHGPVLQNIGDLSVNEGEILKLVLVASDNDKDELTFSNVGLPDFGNLTNDGTLTLEPGYTHSGKYNNISITVSDGKLQDSETLSIDVVDKPQAPKITSVPNISVLEKTSYNYRVTASDRDELGSLIFSLSSFPTGMSINSNTGEIAWATTNKDVGEHEIIVEVEDSTGLRDTQIFTLTVLNVNDAPVALDRLLQVNEDESVEFKLTGSDVDGDALTVDIVSPPLHGTVAKWEGEYLYTPAKNYFGDDSFSYRVSDGQAHSAIASVNISITSVNDSPISSNQTITLEEDSEVSFELSAQDVEGDPLLYHLATMPKNGVLSGQAPDFTYTPNANFFGTDEFEFYVNDGESNSSESLVKIVVQAVNDAPMFSSSPKLSVDEGSTYEYIISVIDVDNDELSLELIEAPQGMILQNGELSWSVSYNDAGQYAVQLKVSDSEFTTTQEFQLSVNNVNRVPKFESEPSDHIIQGEVWRYSPVVTDPDGDQISYSVNELFADLHVDVLTGELTLNTEGLDIGVYDIELKAVDAAGGLAIQYISLEVLSKERRSSHEGTEFWLPFTVNGLTIEYKEDGADTYEINIVAPIDGTAVSVDIPLLGFSETRTLVKDQIETFLINTKEAFDLGALELNGVLENQAIHISADHPVSVYVLNQRYATTDGFVGFPVDSLGREYMSVTYNMLTRVGILLSVDFGQPGPITTIVATEENTRVYIEPIMDVFIGDDKQIETGEIIELTLNEGDVYNLETRGSFKADLTGTVVASDKPIAVFGQNDCTHVPEKFTACDHLVEQIPPLDTLGTEYYTAPLWGRVSPESINTYLEGGDIFKVVAAYDNTQVFIDDELRANLQRGESYEFMSASAQHIKTTHPVLLAQFSIGNQLDERDRPLEKGYTDPFMIIVPPSEQYLPRYTFNTPARDMAYNFINVIVAAEGKSKLMLDGEYLEESAFAEVSPSGYYYAQIPVSSGAHVIESDIPFGAYIYGYDFFESYGYLGGMALTSSSRANNIIVSASDTAEMGESSCISALVTDEFEVPLSGVRAKFDIQGTNLQHAYVFTNFKGIAEYCYQATQSGADSINVTIAELSSRADLTWLPGSTNLSPVITSLPQLAVVEGEPFNYEIQGFDPEGQELSFELIEAPRGMSLSGNTLIWDSVDFRGANYGRISVSVRVVDPDGNVDVQTFKLYKYEPFNSSPKIQPSTQDPIAFVGVPYIFNLEDVDALQDYQKHKLAVTDVDKDAVFVEIVQGPSAAYIQRIDTRYPGAERPNEPRHCQGCTHYFRWTPEAVGDEHFKLSIRDARGADGETLEFDVEVKENQPPSLKSFSPPSVAAIGSRYSYLLDIENDVPMRLFDNLDDVRLVFDNAPAYMSAKIVSTQLSQTLEINWTPDRIFEPGLYSVRFHLEDRVNASPPYEFTLQLINNNQAPVISGVLPNAEVSIVYTYQAQATDPEGGSLSFSLLDGPDGMRMDASGLISWTPPEKAEGNRYAVWYAVTDEAGLTTAKQGWIRVDAFNNRAPTFVPAYRPLFAKVGEPYTHQIQATDREGDLPISYSIGSYMSVADINSEDGTITWTPEREGSYWISAGAKDSLGNYASRNREAWTVQVVSADMEMDAELSFSTSNIIDLGETVTLSVAPMYESSTPDVFVTVDGNSVVVDSRLQAQITPDRVGAIPVVAMITDGVDVVEKTTTLYVRDPEDDLAPIVRFESIKNLSVITSPTDIFVTSKDDNLVNTRLLYKPADEPLGTELILDEFSELYSGDASFDNKVISSFDPTMLENGVYHLFLQATDSNGNVSGTTVSVIVSGDLKVGNFSFTVEDADIPVEGIPIAIKRTYDSRRRNKELDFGFGWSADYREIKLQESVEPTRGWYMYLSDNEGFQEGSSVWTSNAICGYATFDKTVTITLPNGDTEIFQAKIKPTSGGIAAFSDPDCYLNGGRFFDLYFIPIEGTQSTLTAEGAKSLYLQGLDNGNLGGIDEAEPRNIVNYTLTTRSGYIYQINQLAGLEKITTPNGHTLTYTDDGILHSSGKSITFQRDEKGRIEKIVDSKGNTYGYYYDNSGNLEEFRNAVQESSNLTGTVYTYSSEHGLVDILDPLGRKIIKNLYDDEGRLYAQEDGEGNIKTFSHNLDQNSSVVTDRDGRTKIFNYDDRGNVLTEVLSITDGTYSDDIVTTYTYDANDNQETKVVGSEDFIWKSNYDDNDNLLLSEDPENNRVEYLAYNLFGQETQIKDELGRLTTMHYDDSGNLTGIDMPTVIDPDTGEALKLSASNVLNNAGQVESTRDLRGLTTTYTYYPPGHENAGQKWTESNPVSGTLSYTYDANNNVASETRERKVKGSVIKETVTYDYDKLNRLTKTRYPDSSYTQTDYDLVGNVKSERDRFGVWTHYSYDAYGRLRETQYADGTKETRTYSNEGLLKTVTDRSNHTSTYDYDDAGRQWKITYHDGSFTETRYTPQGWVQYEWDENRNLTEYEYDKAGKRKAVIRHYTDAAGSAQTQEHRFDYYANGELKTETDALNHSTTYVMNGLDQRIETQFHNGTHIKNRYDAMGARERSIDQNTIATDYRYDDLGRLKAVQADVYIDGTRIPATEYTYDEVGNKLSQTDANGHTTTWTYDYFGRVLTRTLPEGMSERFVYDDENRTQTHTDFNHQVTVTYFDDMGQVEKVVYDNGEEETYSYWPNGQVHLATDKNGTTEYIYDVRDRLESEIQPNGYRLDYDYDAVGNRTEVRVSQGGAELSKTTYTYDELNRLATVTDAQGTTAYTYDAVGNLNTVTYPNGIVEDYDYNSVNQLTVLTLKDTDGNIINRFTYGLDDTGRRNTITEANGRFTDYDYDDLYRLTSEIITDAINGNYEASYQYDWVGNRTYETVNGVQTAYSYDDNDRLLQQGGTKYSYDNNGNLTSETLDSTSKTYRYDKRNKLTSVETPAGDIRYTYNVHGIRNSKTEAGATTQFVVDSNRDYAQVLLETDGTNGVQYTYGHDLISQVRDGNTNFHLYDGLGSTRALSDSAGAITDTYDYEAFGEVLNQTGNTLNSYLFAGEQFDTSLDQYYLRARYYDQGVGRFTSMDTWQGLMCKPITINKFIYANSDPANGIDPSGKLTLNMQMSALGGLGTLSTLSTTTFKVGAIAAATVGISVSIFYNDLKMAITDLGITLGMFAESGSTSTGTAAQRQQEYMKAKSFCDTPPDPGRNDCATLSKKIDHAEHCVDLYEDWDNKWLKGRHAEKILSWQNRIENLKEEHHRRCTNKP